jgi:hypothetical protein
MAYLSFLPSSSWPHLVFLILLLSITVQQIPIVKSQQVEFSSPDCDGTLTEFSSDDNDVPQSATFLDLSFQCVYDTDNPGEDYTYTWVAPNNDATTSQITNTIRIQPGPKIGFYSTPPDVYKVASDFVRDDQIYLVQNAIVTNETDTPSPPSQFGLVITFPPDQLNRLRIGGIAAADANIVIEEGFTQLRELNASMVLGGLDAVISTEGEMTMRLNGEMYGGARIALAENNNSINNATELVLNIEIGVGDIQIQGTVQGGTVQAINIPVRTGNVLLDGEILDFISSTGDGPGQFLTNDCTFVQGGCRMLPDNAKLVDPQINETYCKFGPGCLARSRSKVDPNNNGSPVFSCSVLQGLECAAPTEAPSSPPTGIFDDNNNSSDIPPSSTGPSLCDGLVSWSSIASIILFGNII